MGKDKGAVRVQIVERKERPSWGTWIVVCLCLLLMVIAVRQEFGDHSPQYRPTPEPSPAVAVLPAGGWAVAVLVGAGLLAVAGLRIYRRFRTRR